ncbi:MAG: isochorismatase family protein [Candidatus Moranbacteria bacterium]|nr:isochorismatase family protein [Candidatus Moranbacteria bacterium]
MQSKKAEKFRELAKRHGVGLNIVDAYDIRHLENTVGGAFIDLVDGFCTPGCGPLSPPKDDSEVPAMVAECVRLLEYLNWIKASVVMYAEGHEAGQREGVYPEHCVLGTPESAIIEPLRWTEKSCFVFLLRKDCNNGIVGDIGKLTGFIEWINASQIKTLIVGGICTDICVMETVLAILNLRTRGFIPSDLQVIIPIDAVVTYDLPGVHPRDLSELFALFSMQQSGALIVEQIVL